MLEERGVVSAGDGAKPRDVLISADNDEVVCPSSTEDKNNVDDNSGWEKV